MMVLQCSHTMLIIFVVTIAAVLIEFNSTTNITARQSKHVFKSKNEWNPKTKRTMNAGNVNTMQKEQGKYIVPLSPKGTKTSIDHESGNNTERGKYIVPLSPKGTKTSIDHESGNNTERGKYIVPLSPKRTKTSIDHESGNNTKKTTAGTKSQAGTTDNYIKDTKNEQENFSYSAVTMMYSTNPTNSSLATNNLTALSHDQDNSEHIGTAVTVSLLVTAVVVGLLFLCYCKKFLCFKRKAKLNEKIKKADEPVGEDTVLNVEVENINMPDTTEDEVDLSSAKTNSPVYEYTNKYNNMHPTSNDENVKFFAIGVL